jgi:hypothetical protein
VLIYHQTIAGKGHWYISRWLLAWLLLLQAARITKLVIARVRFARAGPVPKTGAPQTSTERNR